MKLSGRSGGGTGSYRATLALAPQLQSLAYYDTIGEVRFMGQFYAKLLARCRFYPARLLPDGKTEPITEGLPVEILDRIQDPAGGRSRLQYDYGRLMFVTGEGVLFMDQPEDAPERWRFLWRDEVRKTDDGQWQRVKTDGSAFDPPEIGTAWRLWNPHPRHSDEADWPLRSCLSICQELLALEGAVMATAQSRMLNGIIKIPTQLSPDAFGESGGPDYLGDEDPQTNIFLADWIEHTENVLNDPFSPAARIPFMAEGDFEYLPGLEWMPTHDNQTDYMEKELREEAVRRLARAGDFSPEFLLGMTDANHWTARQVVYDQWRTYGYPCGERFADDIAETVLRPELREEGYEGWENVVVGMDDSQVVIPPDRTADALKAYEDGLLSGDATLEALGWGVESKMQGEELDRWLAVKLRAPELAGVEPMTLPQRGPLPNGNGSRPEDSPPSPSRGREVSRQESRTASAHVLGLAQAALFNCRELAGKRIGFKCKECVEGQTLSVVASAHPHLVIDPMEMVRGGANGFRDLLIERNFEKAQATALAQQLEVYAARTLFQERCPDLSPGFVAAVEKAREVSDVLS